MYSRNPLSMYFSEHIERILPTPHRNLDWVNHPLNQGLVGYWPLRRQFQTPSGLLAKDYSGNDNDGTINNGPVLVDDATVGRMTSWDGLDDRVQVTDTTKCDIATENFAAFGLFRRQGDTGTEEIIMRKQVAGAGRGFRISLLADQLTFFMNSSAEIGQSMVVPTTVGPLYAWGISFNRSALATMYLSNIDTGALSTATKDISAQSDTLSNSRPLTLGQSSEGGSVISARMAEIRLYKGRTFTQDDFMQLVKLGLKRL